MVKPQADLVLQLSRFTSDDSSDAENSFADYFTKPRKQPNRPNGGPIPKQDLARWGPSEDTFIAYQRSGVSVQSHQRKKKKGTTTNSSACIETAGSDCSGQPEQRYWG